MPEKHSLTSRLTTASPLAFALYAGAAGFATYFCMYAFRKPFAAAKFSGAHFLGTSLDLKTAFVISQIIGYALSKYIGVKVCSEVSRGRRARLLVGLILCAESTLFLFALTPPAVQVAALFLNGLPLGMVWGLVVRYLEGRRTSELLLAALSCSFIVSNRLMAWTRGGGTAVFAIYLADAAGYTGSVGVQLYKDLGQTDTTRLAFFRVFTYGLSVAGAALLAGSCWFFVRRTTPSPSTGVRPCPPILRSV